MRNYFSETPNWRKCFRRQFFPLLIQTNQKGALSMLKSLILALAVLAAFSTVQAQEKATPPSPTDAQIAMIAVTANSVDIDAAKMADQKLSLIHISEPTRL